MTQLLVGTKKGLFVLEGEPGGGFQITERPWSRLVVRFPPTAQTPPSESIHVRVGR